MVRLVAKDRKESLAGLTTLGINGVSGTRSVGKLRLTHWPKTGGSHVRILLGTNVFKHLRLAIGPAAFRL